MDETLKLLKALSDKTRLKIVQFLMKGEKCVCEIFPHLKRTQSTTSIQLEKLKSTGIIASRKEGRKVFYKIKNHKVCDVLRVLNNKKVNCSGCKR